MVSRPRVGPSLWDSALALVAAAPVTAQNRQAPAAPAAGPAVRIAYLFSDGNVPGTLAAYKALLRGAPELRAGSA